MPNHDESRFKYNIEYQPSYARYDMQMNQKEVKKKMAFLLRDKIRKFTISMDKLLNTNLVSRLSRHNLQKENYDELCTEIVNRKPDSDKAIPGMFVDWDNTPRRGEKGRVCIGSTPEKFGLYLKQVIRNAEKYYHKDMIFIFAWNEWAEGGYLEPDTVNRYSYLEEIKKAVERCDY